MVLGLVLSMKASKSVARYCDLSCNSKRVLRI
jgi:hypothetical protein